jgi:hypothetical protein
MMKRTFTIALLALAVAAPAWALTTAECWDCHSDFTEKSFKASVHGDMECTDCHTSLAKAKGEHDTPVARVDCAGCHDDVVKVLDASAHSPKNAAVAKDLPSCVDCHGKHDILPKSNIDSRTNLLNIPETCSRCHASAEVRSRHPLLVEDVCKEYQEGMHGRVLLKSGVSQSASCLRCHGSHDIRNTKDVESRVSRKNINKTCGACHGGILKSFNASIHGKLFLEGNPKAPTCVTCHGSHRTERAMDSDFNVKAALVCIGCHKEQGETYRDSYHGQVSNLGYGKVALCSDCHGAHDILPASDPASRVGSSRLISTCAACHPGADESFVQYIAHLDARDAAKNPLYYWVFFAMVCLVAGTFGFFGLHTVLWFIRAFIDKIKHG